MKQFFLFLVAFIACCSCDSASRDLGSGFEFTWINMPESANVYYRHVGLIDDNIYGAVRCVKWSDRYIFVETEKDLCFIIDKQLAGNFQGSGHEDFMWHTTKERCARFHFGDSITGKDL